MGVTASRNLWQIFSAYDGFMTVWDAKLIDDTNPTTNQQTEAGIPLPRLPNRVRPVFKVFKKQTIFWSMTNVL